MNFLKIPTELILNKAFIALKGAAPKILLLMLIKFQEKERITFSYNDVKSVGLSRTALNYGINQLLDNGFIEKYYTGGKGKGDKTIYVLSSIINNKEKNEPSKSIENDNENLVNEVLSNVKKRKSVLLICNDKAVFESTIEKLKKNIDVLYEVDSILPIKDILNAAIFFDKKVYDKLNINEAIRRILYKPLSDQLIEKKEQLEKLNNEINQQSGLDIRSYDREIMSKQLKAEIKDLEIEKVLLIKDIQDMKKSNWSYIKRIIEKRTVILTGNDKAEMLMQDKYPDILSMCEIIR